jgi:hypothetical protein
VAILVVEFESHFSMVPRRERNLDYPPTDFGLSITKSSIQRMTASQKLAVAGSMGYMAPEMMTDGKVSEFSDVYAFGVVMSFVFISS